MLAKWVIVLLALCPAAHADQLVFGSFRSSDNASNWAQKLNVLFATDIRVSEITRHGGLMFRVSSEDLTGTEFDALRRRADAAGIRSWRLASVVVPPSPVSPLAETPLSVPSVTSQNVSHRRRSAQDASRSEWDLGLQTRSFADSGVYGQDRLEASASFQFEYFRGWDNDTRSITFSPFLRLDSADDERTHGDIRELFYSRVGDDWDLHVGAKRVFWGVTEFHHLIDIINQTDLVENIDTEDKLGQPMVQLSLVRDWGVIDTYALLGFRERTFPGTDGRIRLPLKILHDATYASGAEQRRMDLAVRWSHYMGPIELGLHHFSGTSRDPMLRPEQRANGRIVLRPHYPVIDQTGLDAQALFGDWAFKVEAFTRSGFGDRYVAANVGFERTVVGVLGSRADFGIVAEYMFDERGDEATNTIFEHDVALGGRFQLNDFADTQALFGVIFDTENDDYIVSLEASRRLSDTWRVSLEGRVFAGGKSLRPALPLATLLRPEYKTAWLQEDDYVQLEFKKFL